MTSSSAAMVNKCRPVNNSPICTTDSSMQVSHVRDISIANLSLADVFLVPELALNHIFMGQLCELGLVVHFSSRGCRVQDPQSGQILETGGELIACSKLFP